jgi:hypothetical protein
MRLPDEEFATLLEMVLSPWMDGNRDAWWDGVVRWVRAATVAALGVENAVVGVDAARMRPWGVTAPVLAGTSRLVFKATEPKRAFEGPLTEVIGTRWPALAPRLHALHDEHQWMLQAHHGEPIRDSLPVAEQVTAISSFLSDYGEMQASTVAMVDGWIAAGVPDRRVSVLPDQFESFLMRPRFESELRASCIARLPALRRACSVLSETNSPDALEHADVHGTNVLTADGHHVLIDWGDCCATHPFTALFVPIRFVAASLPSGERPQAARRLRDAYLEPWGGPSRENLDRLSRASVVAPIVRVLSLASEPDGEAEIAALLRRWATDLAQAPRVS